jgi:hypothetical protein
MFPPHRIEAFPTMRTIRSHVVRLPLGQPRGLNDNRMATRAVAIIEDDMGLTSLPVTVDIAKFAGGNVVGIVATLIGDHTDVAHTI